MRDSPDFDPSTLEENSCESAEKFDFVYSCDRILGDPCLKMDPTVHLLRLPEQLINSHLPASCLDHVYSTLEKTVNLKRKRSASEDDGRCGNKKWAYGHFIDQPPFMECSLSYDSSQDDIPKGHTSDLQVESVTDSMNLSGISSLDSIEYPTSKIDCPTESDSRPTFILSDYKLIPWIKSEPSDPPSTPQSPRCPYSIDPSYLAADTQNSSDNFPTTMNDSVTNEMDYDQENQEDSIPYNWLDVSKVKLTLSLIVESVDRNGRRDAGKRLKARFKEFYCRFGRFWRKIDQIKAESNYIKLCFDDEQSRNDVKNDLEHMIRDNMAEGTMFVTTPQLDHPCIQFESRVLIDRRNQYEWIDRIKKLNHWPEDSFVIWKSASTKSGGWYKIKLFVESRIRTMIEERNGFILIDEDTEALVTDTFKLIQCYRCFAYGHGNANCQMAYRNCFFCGDRLHEGVCPVRDIPESWFCRFCHVKGHSACSKECPVLLRFLVPELERIDHKYRFVFLERDRGRDVCNDKRRRRQPNQQTVNRRRGLKKSPPNTKSIVNSLARDKLIDPHLSDQIYRKLREHFGP